MVKRYATKQDFTHEYMMSGDPDGRYVDFADYDALAARLAEAERILRAFAEDRTADAWPAMQRFLGTADSASTDRESAI